MLSLFRRIALLIVVVAHSSLFAAAYRARLVYG